MINSNCDLKIAGFSLARPLFFYKKPSLSSSFEVARWYTAPELLEDSEINCKSVDLWSIGCILAEML